MYYLSQLLTLLFKQDVKCFTLIFMLVPSFTYGDKNKIATKLKINYIIARSESSILLNHNFYRFLSQLFI